MAVESLDLNLAECSIAELRRALDCGAITAVDLVSRYLAGIAAYDIRVPMLNWICVLTPNVFTEAQASDDWRASGQPARPLEGIPYTVKDSYMVKGMTVAAGSSAFADLVAQEDCFVVERLRVAGAILIGRTNMPPMADGGCQRGVYGRAESPYNADYLTAAFASGSSNGSGTSTAASFAAFGMGGETVSSGRSPASKNGLVGYSPSRGVISCRGAWPLYPTCDVLVPHTRSMADLFEVLNVLVADDHDIKGDFWRQQPFINIPVASKVRPASYLNLKKTHHLHGKRVAVPKRFIGGQSEYIEPAHISAEGLDLWNRARRDLESLGAMVVETDFPLLEEYESEPSEGKSCHADGFPADWNSTERNAMIALSWDEFLRNNNDLGLPCLTAADPSRIHTRVAPMDDPLAYTEAENIVRYEDIFEVALKSAVSLWQLPGCEAALHALENARRKTFESWMDDNGLDLVVFPTAGDVAKATAELDCQSMRDALRHGVKYSNGGRAIKHLGIPAVTVPMGDIAGIGMPVGLMFLSKAYNDSDMLASAFAFEHATRRRTAPSLAPALPSDTIRTSTMSLCKFSESSVSHLQLSITNHNLFQTYHEGKPDRLSLNISGEVSDDLNSELVVDVFVHGCSVGQANLKEQTCAWQGVFAAPLPPKLYKTERKVPSNQAMVVILARSSNGRSAGQLLFVG